MEIRILGCLVEKERTTPDNYPLSTNALTNACNQTSNRDPVVSYDETDVDQAVLGLRTAGLARTVTGGRANKHRHVLEEGWGLSPAELALLAVLFLRGPQTTGELRTRTERMQQFEDLDQVESILSGMAEAPEPWVVRLERVPGQKERRWMHLCAAAAAPPTERHDRSALATNEQPTEAPPSQEPVSTPARLENLESPEDARVAELANQVIELRADVDRLYELLGETPERDG